MNSYEPLDLRVPRFQTKPCLKTQTHTHTHSLLPRFVSVSVSVSLSLSLSLFSAFCVSLCLSVSLSIRLPACPSVHQSVSLSAWPAAWPAVYLCLSLSVCMSGEQTLIFLQPNILGIALSSFCFWKPCSSYSYYLKGHSASHTVT